MPVTINYNSGQSVATILYDGTGARAKKTVGSTITYYIGDHYEIIGGTITRYIFAGNLRVAQAKGSTGSTITYFHKDHLGSSAVMTTSSGSQIESTNYMPFGGMRAHSGTTTSNYKFTDQELDAENGLYNYDARLYDPIIGRFISPDTIVPEPYNPQSLNRYSYCLNNPLIYVDPSGYDEETEEERKARENGVFWMEEWIIYGTTFNTKNDTKSCANAAAFAAYQQSIQGLQDLIDYLIWLQGGSQGTPPNIPQGVGPWFDYLTGGSTGGNTEPDDQSLHDSTKEGKIVGRTVCRNGEFSPEVVYNPYQGTREGEIIADGITEGHERKGHIDLGHYEPCTPKDEGQEARRRQDLNVNCAEMQATQKEIIYLNNAISGCNGDTACINIVDDWRFKKVIKEEDYAKGCYGGK